MSLELNNVSSGYSTGVINDNFQALEAYINDKLLNRDGTEVGEANQMELPLDMNSNAILNAVTDIEDSGSLITVGDADNRYVNVTGDTMQGSLNMDSYPVFVRIAVGDNEPVRKDELDQERSERISQDETIRDDYQAGDSNLQSQISGLADIPIAERPIIQWHGQVIENSLTIPDDVNAFTFGPTIEIADGQTVTVGDNSHWTIAEGVEANA